MNILIIGVSGFIGHHLYDALSHQGHHVKGMSRTIQNNVNWQQLDFSQSIKDWEKQLQGVDLVINAVGIFKETATQKFAEIHDLGPKKLFSACNNLGIKIIQVSAIGAEHEHPVTDFLKTKRNADQFLLENSQQGIVLYPGIVLGESGKTTHQLCLLASLPCIPLVFKESDALPLVSIQQLSEFVINTINDWPETSTSHVVIAQPETMKALLSKLRKWTNKGKGCFIAVPQIILELTFKLFPKISFGNFNQQSIDMLSACSMRKHTPVFNSKASDSITTIPPSSDFLQKLKLDTLFYINIITLAFIWIMSGVVSLVNIEESRALISLTGMSSDWGDSVIYLAASGDVILGMLLLFPGIRKLVIYLQLLIILIYTVIITLLLPVYWLHPFTPVIKNLAMVMLAFYILVQEKE